VFEFLFGIILLGIPFIFELRTRARRDIEALGLYSPAPALMIGACCCLVAAIVLCGAITFIAIPGIDAAARTAALVAVLCSVASMIGTLLALLRYKLDLERAPSLLGGGSEGVLVLSVRLLLDSVLEKLADSGWSSSFLSI
jgi:amino acid transporter